MLITDLFLFLLMMSFNMNNNIGNPGLNNVSGMANMSGSINGNANGIMGRDIPAGQEDLYVLKSQIVPPVCPACPVIREQKMCSMPTLW